VSDLPPVGLLAEPGSAPGFVALVAALGAWCRPLAAPTAPVAWLASSPAVAGEHRPIAVWVDGHVETPDGPVPFPHPGLDLRDYVPLSPVVRSRWRSRLGLPATMVVEAAAIPDELVPTALAVASVVIATGARLAEALAWAAPCVTDSASAGALGAGPGDVAVGPLSLAHDIAGDDGRAAALSAAGRRLAERRLDQHRAARRVAAALALLASTHPARRVLDDLYTPGLSPLRRRIDALAL
jgi:hypothetical protein